MKDFFLILCKSVSLLCFSFILVQKYLIIYYHAACPWHVMKNYLILIRRAPGIGDEIFDDPLYGKKKHNK